MSLLDLMRKGRGICLLFSLFLSLDSLLSALDQTKPIHQFINNIWTSDNGLPENRILAITQTEDGYLWFGSQQGLLRFNSYTFQIFDEFNTPEISYSSITCLYPKEKGGLWIGTRGGGLNYYENGRFEFYTSAHGLSSNFITCLLEDKDGTLWIGTENHGLNKFKNGQFSPLNSPDTIQINLVNQIIQDSHGTMWIATGSGLFKYHENSLTRIEDDGLSIANISSLSEDKTGAVWIGTEGDGLYRLSDNRLQKVRFNGITTEPDNIQALLMDRAGRLWVGARRGLVRYHPEKCELFSTEQGLSNNQVLRIFEDREGSLWIGTQNGLNQLKERSIFLIDVDNGLFSDMVWSVYEDSNQSLWLGTNGGGLSKIKNGEVTTFTQNHGLPSNVVRCISQDSQGYIWAGTRKGLVKMNTSGLELRTYGKRSGLSNEIVRVFFEDSIGRRWVGTSNGLFRMEGEQFIPHPLTEESAQIIVFCIREDKNGSLWIGTHLGAYRILEDRIDTYAAGSELENLLVLDISTDIKGEVWLATHRGLFRWIEGGFTRYERNDGLIDNMLYAVRIDNKDNLWMSSNKGIFYLNRKDLLNYKPGSGLLLKPKFFNKADGMKSLECNGGGQSSSCLTKEGVIWFPTVSGAVGVMPDERTFKRDPPPLFIEAVLVNDRPVDLQTGLKLKAGTRKIEFRYAALTYLFPEKTEFRTYLENFDERYYDAGNQNSIYYTNLPPGSFTFHVTAKSPGGPWNSSKVSFSFSKRPFFYQTWIFYFGCFLFAVLLGLGLYRIRVRSLVKREKELKDLAEKQMVQLQEANDELERLTIMDDLTGIFNNRRFTTFYDYEWNRAVRTGSPLSLIIIDIDFFKNYNDTYGHVAGDVCLRKVAEALQKSVKRSTDMVARIGGEEFAIVLTETGEEGTLVVAEDARQKVMDLKIRHKSSSIFEYVTVSLGCATMKPQRDTDSDVLIKTADKALYHSKQSGRNQTTQLKPEIKVTS